MADITLTLNGDASGAAAALEQTGEATGDLAGQTGKAVVAWQMMADVATKAAGAVVKYGIDAVRAFAQAERVQGQLNRAAGEYGEILGAQADALERKYAVDGDLIKQSSTLLTQWGGVGAATEEVTTAILNYAAATGVDAVAATELLIRNVESGGTGLAKMGIAFEATGKRGHDLTAAVAAINAKLGGAADADADSLVGGARAAELAVDQLQESIGGMLATAADETGALSFFTERIRELTVGLEVAVNTAARVPKLLGWVLRGGLTVDEALADVKQTAVDAFMRPGNTTGRVLPKVDDEATNKGRKDKGGATTKPGRTDEERLADAKKYFDGLEQLEDHDLQREEDAYAKELELSGKRVADAKKESDDLTAIMMLEIARDTEAQEKRDKEAAKAEEKALKDSQERSAKKVREAQTVGDQIGAAMVNALTDQLAKLAEGGEFDVAIFVSEILAAAVGVAGTVIGTAFGQPAVGAAIGNLAAMGIRAGGSAISKSGKRADRVKQYHDGGWIDAERYHEGGPIGADEVPIIAQRGEFMMSRAMVRNAGGPGAVNDMARGRGGGGLTLNVQAIDAKSMADTFAGSGGDGLKQALRRGHGALPALLGRNPR